MTFVPNTDGRKSRGPSIYDVISFPWYFNPSPSHVSPFLHWFVVTFSLILNPTSLKSDAVIYGRTSLRKTFGYRSLNLDLSRKLKTCPDFKFKHSLLFQIYKNQLISTNTHYLRWFLCHHINVFILIKYHTSLGTVNIPSTEPRVKQRAEQRDAKSIT